MGRSLFLSCLVSLCALVGCASQVTTQANSPAWWLDPAASPYPINRGPPPAEFPASELKNRHAGHTLLEYSVSPQGRAVDIAVLETDSGDFARETRAILEALIFAVPTDWRQIGGVARRYKIQVVYNIVGLPTAHTVPDVPTVVITHQFN